ncbi:hypothetical protein EDD15DRAFT_1600657 [Pisolithus albus]|nr:hypothetical protein EDD15DRAFT_1600657 [Pisolithus albus]
MLLTLMIPRTKVDQTTMRTLHGYFSGQGSRTECPRVEHHLRKVDLHRDRWMKLGYSLHLLHHRSSVCLQISHSPSPSPLSLPSPLCQSPSSRFEVTNSSAGGEFQGQHSQRDSGPFACIDNVITSQKTADLDLFTNDARNRAIQGRQRDSISGGRRRKRLSEEITKSVLQPENCSPCMKRPKLDQEQPPAPLETGNEAKTNAYYQSVSGSPIIMKPNPQKSIDDGETAPFIPTSLKAIRNTPTLLFPNAGSSPRLTKASSTSACLRSPTSSMEIITAERTFGTMSVGTHDFTTISSPVSPRSTERRARRRERKALTDKLRLARPDLAQLPKPANQRLKGATIRVEQRPSPVLSSYSSSVLPSNSVTSPSWNSTCVGNTSIDWERSLRLAKEVRETVKKGGKASDVLPQLMCLRR